MHETIKRMANAFAKQRVQRRRAYALFTALALVVSTMTTYLLVQPASTMEVETICDLVEHVHGDGCYELQAVCGLEERETEDPGHTHAECHSHVERVLICEIPVQEAHTHVEECYGPKCGKNETAGHTHGDGCYEAEQVLTCTMPVGHKHGDGCYPVIQIPTCQDTTEGHEHTDACYSEKKADEPNCGQEETAEVHSHDESCYTAEQKLVCALAEEEPHAHADSCTGLICTLVAGDGHAHADETCCVDKTVYDCGEEERPYAPAHTHEDGCWESVLVCGLEEHTHDESCYPETYCGYEAHNHNESCRATEQVLICPLAEGEEHTHTDACYETKVTEPVLTCDLEEIEGHAHGDDCYGEPALICEDTSDGHVHGEDCYAEAELICVLEEAEGHKHADACYSIQIVCGLEEHTHTEACYEEPELMILLPEGAEIPEGYDVEYSVTDEENRYAVAVYAPTGALPEGAELKADLLDEDSDEYAAAEEAMEAEYDGMVALDIRFELDGKEVEPTEPVYVYMNVVGLLPETVDPESVAVHHIKETEEKILNLITVDTEVTVDVVADTTEDTEGIVEMVESEEAAALDMTAVFPVDSFSTFVATYLAKNSDELLAALIKMVTTELPNTVDEVNALTEIELNEYAVKGWQAWYLFKCMTSPDQETFNIDHTELKNALKTLVFDRLPKPEVVYQTASSSPYYGTSSDLRSDNITCIKYSTANPGGIVNVDSALPSEYGANGLTLGLDPAESIEIVLPSLIEPLDTESGDIAAGAKILVNDYGYTDDNVQANYDIARYYTVVDNTYVKYINVGMYKGHKIDVKVSIHDYRASGNAMKNHGINNGEIGLRTIDKIPGVNVTGVSWVQLKYEFFISGTDDPIPVKGSTSYYDVDGSQVIYMDDTCKGIYVTEGTEEKSTCELLIGKVDNNGYGIYDTSAKNQAESNLSYAFTEIFDTGTENWMLRTFSFEEGGKSDGWISHYGLPVVREGTFYVKKQVESSNGKVVPPARSFDFTVTLNDKTITDSYGDVTFTNGEGSFTLADDQAIQVVGLPAGTEYTVTETAVDNYVTEVNGVGGYRYTDTIKPSVEMTEIPVVEFVNTYQVGEAVLDKTVDDTDGLWINLEAYVTGETTTVTNVKPLDVVLVLDESASMHKPAKATADLLYTSSFGGSYTRNDATYYENNPDQLIADKASTGLITRTEFEAMFEGPDREANLEKARQLGYFIARRAGAGSNCSGDWIKLQYTDEGWFGYRVYRTNEWTTNSGNYATTDWSAVARRGPFDTLAELNAELGNRMERFYITQYGKMYDAVTELVDELETSGGDHRLGIVTFSSTHRVYTNNGLLNVKNGGEALTTAVKSINSNYPGICLSGGIYHANQIFENYPIDKQDNRERVMIVITDGEPNASCGYTGSSDINNAISGAFDAKKSTSEDGYDATVYTVATSTLDDKDFLHYISSEYPDAVSSSKPGSKVEQGTYCYTEDNADNLLSIVESITTTITNPTTALDTTTILRDVISSDFVLDEHEHSTDCYDTDSTLTCTKTERSIGIFLNEYENGAFVTDDNGDPVLIPAPCNENQDGHDDTCTSCENIKADVNGQKIEVTGFHYSKHFVNDGNEAAAKIVVRIPIAPSATNKGGNEQATNDGADLDDEPFPDPYVDIPTTVKIRKEVEGTTDTSGSFNFTAEYNVIGEYDKENESTKPNGSNYLSIKSVAAGTDTEKTLGHTENFDDATKIWEIKGVVVQNTDSTVDGVKDSTITVTEAAAPGYHVTVTYTYDGNDSGPITAPNYTIGNDGSVSVTIPVHPGLEITFTNSTGPVLPSTGGMGTRVYITVGSALMIGASLILIEQERRRRRSVVK